MKSKLILLTALLGFGFTPAFANTEATLKNPTHNETKAHKKDGEILGWLVVVNQSEIDAANEAKKRKLNDDVMEFADWMAKEHTKNLDDTNDVSKKLNEEPTKTHSVASFEKKEKKKLESLVRLDDKKFEKDYMKAMVKGHTEALKTVDKYLKEVKDADLKNLLTETREHIVKHLDKAKSIKVKMK